MGRKKIQITRIQDERNRQVRLGFIPVQKRLLSTLQTVLVDIVPL